MTQTIKTIIILVILSLLSLLFRVHIATNTINTGDILVHHEWSKTLYGQGLKNSYFHPVWTYSPPTQPPLMMTAYKYSRSIYENRNFFSAMHNLTKFPPSKTLLWFQEYGDFLTLRLWEYLATILVAILTYYFIRKKYSFKFSLLAFSLIIFNPITLFLNGVWGQNDILPTLFLYASFLLLYSKYSIFSPVVFTLGLLFKPTIIVLLPLFALLYLIKIIPKNNIQKLIKIMIPALLILLLVWLCFKPYLNNQQNIINDINQIYTQRMQNSSKGANIASVSAFNFYSLFYDIDKTRSNQKIFLIDLNTLGIISYVLINLIIFKRFIGKKDHKTDDLLFSIYFISQGTFLFVTNMLDRYFAPAFVSSAIMTVIYWKKYGPLMLLQQLLWFTNLIYAYYYRYNSNIDQIFRGNSYLVIRILSLLNLTTFFLISKKYFKSDEK